MALSAEEIFFPPDDRFYFIQIFKQIVKSFFKKSKPETLLARSVVSVCPTPNRQTYKDPAIVGAACFHSNMYEVCYGRKEKQRQQKTGSR